MGGRYARFLIEEILPEVAKKYRISDDPNLRGIGGSSSGGIAAFTAAWERPDAFRRVLMFVGSFTNLRGGDVYPGLIRKVEPKPLKIFMQDGANDLNIYSGSWWMANQDVHSALEYAGYDVKFVRGEEGHNNKHGRSILPEGLRWLWAGWDKPIQANRAPKGERHWILEYTDPASGWELVSEGHTLTEGPALAPNGDVYFTDLRESKIWKIDAKTDKVSLFKENTGRTNGLMFSRDGILYSCRAESEQIVAIDVATGKEEVIASGVRPNDVAVTANGGVYFTEPGRKTVSYVDPDRKMHLLATEGIESPNGVLLSPDQSLLFVADYAARWVWSFQIQPDGTVANGQPFYHLETGDFSSRSLADGMTVAADGHLFVATDLGVQICDQPGRVVGILSKPNSGPFTNVVFAGPDMQTLYVTAGDKVFRRHMRLKGVRPWETATPPVPRL
jgi:sugar lactone lactonase YvrE